MRLAGDSPDGAHSCLPVAEALDWPAWLEFLRHDFTHHRIKLDFFVLSAQKASRKAVRKAMQESLKDFREWIASSPAYGGVHKCIKDSPEPLDEIYSGGQHVYHPRDVIDEKSKKWHTLWHDPKFDLSEVEQAFGQIRAWAAVNVLSPIDGEEVRVALSKMKPMAGLGIDGLTPLDMQRLPPEGHDALAKLLNTIEEVGTWPTQLLVVLGRLLPKKSGGDRIIGILGMVRRTWSLVREEHTRGWAKEHPHRLGRRYSGQFRTSGSFHEGGRPRDVPSTRSCAWLCSLGYQILLRPYSVDQARRCRSRLGISRNRAAVGDATLHGPPHFISIRGLLSAVPGHEKHSAGFAQWSSIRPVSYTLCHGRVVFGQSCFESTHLGRRPLHRPARLQRCGQEISWCRGFAYT